MKRILFLVMMLCASKSWASVHTVSTCNSTNIQSAFDAATESGGEVFLDCATGSITARVHWDAPGANAKLYGRGSTSILGGNDQTILIDDDTTNEAKLQFTPASTGTFQIYGLTIQGGTGSFSDQGIIKIAATSATIRIHHFHWDGSTYTTPNTQKWMYLTGQIYGVMDHNIIKTESISWIHIANAADNNGDANWAAATGFGGANFFFIEDNTFDSVQTSPANQGSVEDCVTGGRFVIRFNTLVGMNVGQTHPTGHSSDNRGCRASEQYGNVMTPNVNGLDPPFCMICSNAGGGLFWNNQATNVFKNIFVIYDVRVGNQADGQPYNQVATPNGWGNLGTAHGPSSWDRNDDATGYYGIDQPGRGQGDLLTGDFPSKIDSVTGTIHHPNEALEPIYTWMTVGSVVAGWGGIFYSTGGPITSDRDYYQQASGIQTNATTPFNGTTGTGWGTLANRPTTCTTGSESGGGVGYFATDQGSWNQSASNSWGVQMSGADGVLYRCSATNTWTVAYTPYTYPHPLQGASSQASTTIAWPQATPQPSSGPRFSKTIMMFPLMILIYLCILTGKVKHESIPPVPQHVRNAGIPSLSSEGMVSVAAESSTMAVQQNSSRDWSDVDGR